jgi:DNA polymerase, archaea type
MEIRFFPLDFEYKLRDGKVFIYMYGRLEDEGRICVIYEYQPFFYIQLKNIDKEKLQNQLQGLDIKGTPDAKVLHWEEIEKELLGKKQTFWKIFVNSPKAVPIVAKELQSWGVECFEKDILFVHGFLRDTGITPMTLVAVHGEFKEDRNLRIPTFLAREIKQFSKETVKNYKTLALDIETYSSSKEINPQKNPILMIGFYGIDENGVEYKKVLTWKRFKHDLDYLEVVGDEVDMLERFREILIKYQPDIITGYNSEGFDLPYLNVRAEKYGIKFDLGLDRSEMQAEFGKNTQTWIKGMLHLDMYQFIRNIFGKNLKLDSLSLDSVSQELIGHKKHKVDLNKLSGVWDSEPDQLEDFCKYNLHDAHLALKLFRKLYPDLVEFTKIIGIPTYDIIRMRFSRLVENYILKRAMEYKVIAPNRPSHQEVDMRMDETYQGGFVFEPTPGLYEKIVVLDFRSLYPTIISAHNIGPESLNCSCCKDKEHVPGHQEYWFCQERKFIPGVLEQLILRRVDLKRLIKEAMDKGEDTKILEARSYAIKTLANSFYGYMGFFGARWYSLECARSTTAYARNYIKTTIEKAKDKGFKVIYADTDSCFLVLGNKLLDHAKELMNEINFDLPGHMELEFEGFYPHGLFVGLKSSDKGAKKKYALITEEGKLKITGFETVRRNWSPIAKEVQEHVLRLVLEGKTLEALEYSRNIVKELKLGLIEKDKLIIRTQITKELSAYSSIGPHVAVARRMEERGEKISPGMSVGYIIGKGSGLVRERARMTSEVDDGEYDADYYLNNQILPAVNSIFLVLGYKEDELFEDGSQTGLGKFF